MTVKDKIVFNDKEQAIGFVTGDPPYNPHFPLPIHTFSPVTTAEPIQPMELKAYVQPVNIDEFLALTGLVFMTLSSVIWKLPLVVIALSCMVTALVIQFKRLRKSQPEESK